MQKKLTRAFVSILMLLCCGVFSLPIYAQQAQSAFDNANQSLKENDLFTAISRYKTIARGGFESGPLYINLGIAYSKLDSLGLAKAYFLKASEFEETKEQAQKGLEFVNQRFSRNSAVLPTPPWEQFFEWQEAKMALSSWFWIAALLLNLTAILVALYWLGPKFIKSKKWMMYLCLTAFAVSLLAFVDAFILQHRAETFKIGVTKVEEHQVFSKSSTESSTVSAAYEGYTYRVDLKKSRPSDGWYYVRMSNGMYGWVQASKIIVID